MHAPYIETYFESKKTHFHRIEIYFDCKETRFHCIKTHFDYSETHFHHIQTRFACKEIHFNVSGKVLSQYTIPALRHGAKSAPLDNLPFFMYNK